MTEHESENNYIKRVLAMSPDELRAHAEAEGVEMPAAPDLVTSLRNLRFRLEGALAYHVEQGNREEMAWLSDGVIALSAAVVKIAQGTEAGTAETGTGSVHDGLVHAVDAPEPYQPAPAQSPSTSDREG